jgi:hypothetical protein
VAGVSNELALGSPDEEAASISHSYQSPGVWGYEMGLSGTCPGCMDMGTDTAGVLYHFCQLFRKPNLT